MGAGAAKITANTVAAARPGRAAAAAGATDEALDKVAAREPKAGGGDGRGLTAKSGSQEGLPLGAGEILEISVSGLGGHICAVSLEGTATLQELLDAIEANAGIPAGGQRLFLRDKELTGHCFLGNLAPLGDLLSDYKREEGLLLVRQSPEQVTWLREIEQCDSVCAWLARAPADARQDRFVVLTAVARDGLALQFASTELQADHDVVFTAVKQNGWALEFASRELQADRDLVLDAVLHSGGVLCILAGELQADREVVLSAIAQDGAALCFASRDIQAELRHH